MYLILLIENMRLYLGPCSNYLLNLVVQVILILKGFTGLVAGTTHKITQDVRLSAMLVFLFWDTKVQHLWAQPSRTQLS